MRILALLRSSPLHPSGVLWSERRRHGAGYAPAVEHAQEGVYPPKQVLGSGLWPRSRLGFRDPDLACGGFDGAPDAVDSSRVRSRPHCPRLSPFVAYVCRISALYGVFFALRASVVARIGSVCHRVHGVQGACLLDTMRRSYSVSIDGAGRLMQHP